MTLAKLHRLNAAVLAAFLVAHMVNHLALAVGFALHIQMMGALRSVYRGQLIEPILIALFAAQLILGMALIFRRGKPEGGWAWLQVLSGGYLAFFLLQHVPAALNLRLRFPELDTNVYWAASVVSAPPLVWYFAPYYSLAIAALFAHIAAALRFRRWPAPASSLHKTLPWIGLLFGCLVVYGLRAGLPEGLPPAYQAYLDSLLGG